MPANPDFRDLLRAFHDEGVEYLVAGAHAVIFHAQPRYTKDLDLLVRPTLDNARRVWKALQSFGAPLSGVTLEDFANEDLVYQMGMEPNRIDIMMGMDGVDFESAWGAKVDSTYDGVSIHVMSKQHLIQAKRAAGRPQDMLDIDRLNATESP